MMVILAAPGLEPILSHWGGMCVETGGGCRQKERKQL